MSMVSVFACSPEAPPSYPAPETVFVVDDEPSARLSLETTIRASGWHVEAFASAGRFLAHPCFQGPSCLVLDVNLPGLGGVDFQRRLSGRSHMPVILVTGYGDVLMTVQAAARASRDSADLPSAIRHAIEWSEDTLRHEQQVQEVRRRRDSLTNREREVMSLVAEGLLNKQIAFELGISEITVKIHRGTMMRKMKARSLAELIKMAAFARGQAAPERVWAS
jgi:FixJ family two-component response regulator